jgi:serine/threonine-protein kinase
MKRIEPKGPLVIRTLSLPGAIVAALLALASPASADPTAADKAASDALFKEAKGLMAEGHLNEACPKLEESQRLDPTPGTLLNLGDCYERSTPPRTASAWGAFRQAEAMSRQRGDADRQAEAARRAEPIEPVLSKVVLRVAPAARLPGLEVKWDGRAIGAGLLGSAFPVDSGEHTIEAGAPGHKSWTGKVVVKPNGGTANVEVPGLALGASDAVPGALAPELPFWGAQRVFGLGTGIVGLVGVVVGSVFGAKAIGKKSDADAGCDPKDPTRCSEAGAALRREEKSVGTVSTGSFIAGGVLFAGGVVLFATAPHGHVKADEVLRLEVVPAVAGGDLGLSLRGSF